MYLLYSAGLMAALVVASPWLLAASKRRAGLREKLGAVPPRLSSADVWLHAVSVGEVLAVTRLVEALRRRGRSVAVSTTTASGQKLARERFGQDSVFYFPFDFGFAVRPFLRRLNPELVVLAESEFWPNFLRLARQSGGRVAVVNARISDRSLPNYERLRPLWRRVLGDIDLFLARSGEDARRLERIGADPARVRVAGNLKFDVAASQDLPILRELRRQIAGPVLACGSTVDGEEPLVLRAFQGVLAQYPDAVLILAPRHPERFAAVAALISGSGLKLWRRSQLQAGTALSGGVLLLDSIGELAAIYSLATLAFVGGSLVARGGHNILEPAQHGVPIVVGPHMENFRDIFDIFVQRDAVRTADGGTLGDEFLRLLGDAPHRQALGERAAEVYRSEAGATERALAALEALLAGHVPTPVETAQ